MSTTIVENNFLKYCGSNFLKQRLLLSVLSGKPVTIVDIRSECDEAFGLREYEINLIRLLDKLTNGTKIDINSAGTAITFMPGLLHGGQLDHECCTQRGIGYYLDALIALGPFCKIPLNVKLSGVTESSDSPSVDHIKAGALTVLKRFLTVDEGLELKIIKRGLPPLGGGIVVFKCPLRKTLRPIQFTQQGMVKRIRGTAYVCKVSPALGNRAIETAKGVMLKFLPDVYIYADANRGKMSGNAPGFGICLHAETTEGVCFMAQANSHIKGEGGREPSTPEDIGEKAAMRLLDEIYRGGCCDSTYQWLVTLFMSLGQKHVSKFMTGTFTFMTLEEFNKLYYYFQFYI